MGSPTLPDISIDMKPAARWRPAALFFVVTLSGCSGVQSALDPAGEEAGQVADLFWVMVAGGSIIWLLVCGLMIHALRSRREPYEASSTGRLIFWGGVAFPVVTLVLLLGYALWLMPGLRPFAENGASDALRIEITGKQYWWQVVYHPAGGSPVTSANEVRLPVGVPVEITLNSADVIHSFWIPALGGKMDMIPGRTNRLSLRGDQDRDVSRSVRGVLRHVPYDDGIRGRRDGSGRVPAMAGRADPAVPEGNRERRGVVRQAWLRRVPRGGRHRSRRHGRPGPFAYRLSQDGGRGHSFQLG